MKPAVFPGRNWTYAEQVTHAYNGCRHFEDGVVRGYPLANDPLSHWVDEYYGAYNYR